MKTDRPSFSLVLCVALFLPTLLGSPTGPSLAQLLQLDTGMAEGTTPAPPLHAIGRADRQTPLSSPPQHLIPRQAQVVLKAIQDRDGEPPPGYVGGRTFQNRERRLPRGRYREYDVRPMRPGRSRGAERIVIDQQSGKAYYTDDHYRTFVPMN